MSEVGFTTRAASVYEAINRVMAEVGYVQKQQGGEVPYSYAGEAQILAALRPAMVREGLVIFPKSFLDGRFEAGMPIGKSGGTINHATVRIIYTFYHWPTATSFDVEIMGEGMDRADKAFNKAMTDAFKYALRQTFALETGDDPDHEDPTGGKGVGKPSTERKTAGKQGTPPAGADAKPKGTNRWTDGDKVQAAKKALIEGGVLPPDTIDQHLIAFLNLTGYDQTVALPDLVKLGKVYRGLRDEYPKSKADNAMAEAKKRVADEEPPF